MSGTASSPGGRRAGDAPPGPSRLNGWKEIASYFGKGVRTVQRWEAESGLPVHRLGSGRSEAVYAFVDELERWRLTAEARRAEVRSAASPHENGDAEPGQREPLPREPAPRAPEPAAPGPAWRFSIQRAGAAALAVAALAAAWIAWNAFGRGDAPGPGVPPGPAAAAVQPVSARVERGVLNAYGDGGRLLWSYRFDFRLTDSAYGPAVPAGQEHVAVHDIDGDGQAEVLFVSEPTETTSRGLFCFNHDGSLRFRHQPSDTVAFGPLTAAPPWRAFWIRVVGDPGRPHHIWLASSHLSEFPTVVEKLDPGGRVQGRYWSNGQVVELQEAAIDGQPFVFIGGTSNEFRGGTLAVLDERSLNATAPAVNPHYRCEGCPPDAPVHFLVFPRLGVSEAAASYSSVNDIRVDAAGQVMVQLVHPAPPHLPDADAAAFSLSSYVLDRHFHIVKAELGDAYEVAHRIVQGEGLLTRPFSKAREERALWPVLRWEAGRFVEVLRPDHAPE